MIFRNIETPSRDAFTRIDASREGISLSCFSIVQAEDCLLIRHRVFPPDPLLWFLDCLDETIESTAETLSSVLSKARFRDVHKEERFNERQRKIVNMLFDDFFGKLTTGRWAKIAKCSSDTAPKQVRTKAVLSPLFLRFRTDNERTSNGGVVFRDGTGFQPVIPPRATRDMGSAQGIMGVFYGLILDGTDGITTIKRCIT